MKHVARFVVSALLMANLAFSNDSEAEAIKLAQQWVAALYDSVQAQVKAGARDPEKIRKRATEDTQPHEKKLRKAMKAIGSTQKDVDEGIKDDRKYYLDRFIEESQEVTIEANTAVCEYPRFTSRA